jgi:hypothetical protein
MAFQRRVTPNATIIEMDSKHSSDQKDIARYADSSNPSFLNGVVRRYFKMDTDLQSIHAKSSTGDKAHSHSSMLGFRSKAAVCLQWHFVPTRVSNS